MISAGMDDKVKTALRSMPNVAVHGGGALSQRDKRHSSPVEQA